MAKKTAFVTGATGFLGTHIVNSLLRDGWHITAFVRATSKTKALEERGVVCVVGQIRDAESIAAVMPSNVDAVFHAAAMLTLWQPKHAEQWKDNVTATEAMLTAARKKNAKKFVFVSSVSAYGYKHEYVHEGMPQEGDKSPVNYNRTKFAAEERVRAAVAEGLDAVIVNPAHIIGPYDHQAWSHFLILIATNSLPAIPPGGGAFCYAPHVADAIVAAAERGRTGANYLLGGGDATFYDFVMIASRLLGKNETRQPLSPYLMGWIGWLNDLYSWLVTGTEPSLTYEGALKVSANVKVSGTTAQDELGYKTMTLEESLPPTIEWLRANHYI
ncbi:unnamed protein product [Aphanomyces euteiches]